MDTGWSASRIRIVLASLAVTTAGACASAPAPPLVARADPASLACAATLLQAAEYEVGQGPEEVIGEVRMMAGDVGVTREMVTVAMADGMLEVSTAAYRLDPAMHDLPVNRQMASEVAPSRVTRQVARDIARDCAAGTA